MSPAQTWGPPGGVAWKGKYKTNIGKLYFSVDFLIFAIMFECFLVVFATFSVPGTALSVLELILGVGRETGRY